MKFRLFSVLTSLFFLAGCNPFYGPNAYVHDRSNDYQKSHNGVDLKLPPQLSDNQIENSYTIPVIAHQYQTVSLLPPGSLPTKPKNIQNAVLKQRYTYGGKIVEMKFQNNNQQVLLLPAPPDELWHVVENGLLDAGFKVVYLSRQSYRIYILDRAQTNGWVMAATPMYRLELAASGQNTVVKVYNDKNQFVSPASAKSVLTRLNYSIQHPSSFLERLMGKQG